MGPTSSGFAQHQGRRHAQLVGGEESYQQGRVELRTTDPLSPYHDLTSGFKAFRREVLEALDLENVDSNGYSFQIELTHRTHQMGCE